MLPEGLDDGNSARFSNYVVMTFQPFAFRLLDNARIDPEDGVHISPVRAMRFAEPWLRSIIARQLLYIDRQLHGKVYRGSWRVGGCPKVGRQGSV